MAIKLLTFTYGLGRYSNRTYLGCHLCHTLIGQIINVIASSCTEILHLKGSVTPIRVTTQTGIPLTDSNDTNY